MTLLLLLAASVAIVIGAELFARAWLRHRSRYYVFAPNSSEDREIDQEALPWARRLARWRVNSRGERADEPPRERDGVFDVLLAGGSAAEGYFLDQDEFLGAQLQRSLNAPERLLALGKRRAYVASIARSSVGSAELVVSLARVLPNYREPFDLVLVMVGATDVIQWLGRGAPQTELKIPMNDSWYFDRYREVALGWQPRRCALAEIARRVRPRHTHRTGVGLTLKRNRNMRASAREWRAEVPDATSMLESFDRRLASALDLAWPYARRLAAISQPWYRKRSYDDGDEALFWHGGVGGYWAVKADDREQMVVYYTTQVFGKLMDMVYARTRRVAEAAGALSLDVMPHLVHGRASFCDQVHLTPAGTRQMAEALADQLVAAVRGRQN